MFCRNYVTTTTSSNKGAKDCSFSWHDLWKNGKSTISIVWLFRPLENGTRETHQTTGWEDSYYRKKKRESRCPHIILIVSMVGTIWYSFLGCAFAVILIATINIAKAFERESMTRFDSTLTLHYSHCYLDKLRMDSIQECRQKGEYDRDEW